MPAKIRVKIMGPPPIVNGKHADDLHLTCDQNVDAKSSSVVGLKVFEPNPPVDSINYFKKITPAPGDPKTLNIKFNDAEWANMMVVGIDVATDADDINCIEAKWTQGGTVVGNATIIP